MKLTVLPLLLCLTACTFVTEDDWNAFDADGDGWTVNAEGVGEDCDDQDPAIHPDATESCNDIDDDCDGTVDNGVLTTFFVDADGDGWGNADFSLEACTAPSGYVTDDTDGVAFDCDDGEALSYPQAPELCDDEDNDCDGTTDEPDDIAWLDWYRDSDADGYGDPDDVLNDCAQPDGFVADATDCDDGDDAIHPGAEELCDHIDNDCDGLTDFEDTDLIGNWTWHQDTDGDGHGDPSTALDRCEQPTGYVLAGDDCDDARATVYPGADEVCSGLDDDCDGLVDEDDPGLTNAAIWYADSDGDGYGLDTDTVASCDQPSGYAALGGDCDDTDTAYHPGAAETDCADPADYNCDGATGYADADSDGWAACEECDDGDSAVYPGASELCNGYDDDCDGATDEDDAADAPTWYADTDSDGYGDLAVTTRACAAPSGFVAAATDCNDDRTASHPGATEWCNGHDDDCDGTTDEDDATDALTWYLDADSDGYGLDSATAVACTAPSGHATLGGDCDDGDTAYNPGAPEDDCADPADYNCDGVTGYSDADGDGWAACEECDDSDSAVHPDATEFCNGVDDDCDGTTDEGDATDALTWYADTDGDGFGDPASAIDACSAPSGFVANASDCDDTDGAVRPGSAELPADGVDQDCDGVERCYADADLDGYGTASTVDGAALDCTNAGESAEASDCDDGDAAVFPGADEWCDGVDSDCDGVTDEADALDASTWYADADGDGHGEPAVTTVECYQPAGHVAGGEDCDDSDAAVFPGASELCNSVDDDCDGVTDEADALDASTWYADADGDGHGDPAAVDVQCDQPTGYAAGDEDCDDSDAAVFPGADEWCDGVDSDCDGTIDEDDALDATTWYLDADADGHGDSAAVDVQCDQPTGYVAGDQDCDDSDAAVFPGADEWCDGVDSDCDGTIDEDDALDASIWYADGDGDGYGDATSTVEACSATAEIVADATDCDDGDAGVYPGADETWNGVDDDCDGVDLQVVQVTAGGSHTLALLDDETVWAWGSNSQGQIGDGSTTDRSTPVEVSGLAGAVAITAGDQHSLALLDNGTVWTWGYNVFGQLGDGSTTDRSTPAEVSGLTGAVAIAAGYYHSLALLNDGTVWAWGYNSVGQLGDGSTTNRSTPVEVSGLTGAVAISAGYGHSMALLDDGTLWAWGYNVSGQLGDGTTTDRSTPIEVSGLTDVVATAAGSYHSLALLDDGTLWAWGRNSGGQLGDGTTEARSTPVEVSDLTGAVAIAAGVVHSLAVLDDGTVWAWGSNSYGQIGDGTRTSCPTSVEVNGPAGVVAIAAGNYHSIALLDDGTLWAWGDNDDGQLGDGTTSTHSSPIAVDGPAGSLDIAAGDSHSLALLDDGTVWALGNNGYGQLGDGTTTSSSTPVEAYSLSSVVGIVAGHSHSLALLDDGSVWAWGYNAYGQLGDGTTASSSTPTEVSGLSGVVAIAAGSYHSLALIDDGTVWTWGWNEYGQLGDGTTTSSITPVEVSGLTGVVAIAADFYQSLALLDDGTVWAWGNNNNGQLGDGTTASRSTPVEVSGLSGAVVVAAGGGHSLALLDDGTVRSWGYNAYGQLGDGTTTTSYTPVEVGGLAIAVEIAAGSHHSQVLLEDGTVWSWGRNSYGQLGDGTTTDRSSPAEVSDISGVAVVAAGSDHSLALLDDGTVYAWGHNSNGQLGFDTWSPQPVAYPE